MERARRHQRLLSVAAFGLIALAAELAGCWLVTWIDVGRHLPTPSYSGAAYYPVLLVLVKVGIALMLARLAWRVARARAALRMHGATGRPRVRVRLSPRLWLVFFALTSTIYLAQADAERMSALSPWLHTSALPVFAVLAVVCALMWSAVQRWLADYEEYAEKAVSRVLLRPARMRALRPTALSVPPRRLFGLAFESRPPPLVA